jgi:hypothetical protein
LQPSQKRSFLNHLHSLSLLFRSTRDSDRVRNSRFRALDIADEPRLDGLERGVVASHFHDVIGHHLLFKLVGKAGRRRLVGHSIFAAADYSGDRGNLKYTVLSGARCQAADHRSGKRRECRDVCDIHALIMDGREGTDARKSANQPWRTTILSRRQGESGAWPCAISLADWLAPAARDFCVSVGYRVHPILIWRIAIAFWNAIQLTSQSEKSCQMAVPPNRALLVAEVPFSGRARVRAFWYENYRFSASRAPGVGSANSITPRAKRACSDAGVIWSGRWASIVLAFPEADGPFVDCEHCREVSLCHAGKSPRRAQLPTSDEIDTPIGHGRLVICHVRR